MLQNSLCIGSSAKLCAAQRDTADRAGLYGQRHLIGDAFFGGNAGNLLRHTGAQIDDCVVRQLHSGTASDNLALVQRDCRNSVQRNGIFARSSTVIWYADALHVVLVRTDDNGVNIDARNLDQLRVKRTGSYDFLNLNNDLTAGVFAGLRHSGNVHRANFTVYGAVAALIAVGSAQEYDVDREALVQQALLALDLDQLDQIFLGDVVELAAAVARVSKGVQTNVRDGTDVVCGDITIHVSDNALREVVRLDLVFQSQLAQSGSTIPMAADNALYHAFVCEVVAAGTRNVTIALTCGIKQRHVLRMTGLKKALLQRLGQSLRASTADESAGGNGVAVVYQLDCLFRRQYFNFLHWKSSFLYNKERQLRRPVLSKF